MREGSHCTYNKPWNSPMAHKAPCTRAPARPSAPSLPAPALAPYASMLRVVFFIADSITDVPHNWGSY